MYTNDRTTQMVVAMLKAYGIRDIVISPGTRNCGFAASVQNDKDFHVYSVVDERSAAYFATGLAYEKNVPVVISCTGATASRNYLSALTEAFYRNLPIVALTFGHETGNAYNLTQQHLDRSVSQNDVKLCSMRLPRVCDEQTRRECELMLNVALARCMYGRRGPVHLDVVTLGTKFDVPSLPKVTRASFVSVYDLLKKQTVEALSAELEGLKTGIFIGSHVKMSASLTKAISSFARRWHAPVFVDHTSSYHGSNKVLIAQICDIKLTENRPDVMIDLGSICGQYSLSRLFEGTKVWRVSDMGELRQRAGTVVRFFDCAEEFFFSTMLTAPKPASVVPYHEEIRKEADSIEDVFLPFAGAFVSQSLAENIPAGSALHVSILNSLRSVNFFDFPESVDILCNVGGFGIDGALSTLVGQSVADRDRLYFAQVGDLSFFYDMNVLGNRHVGDNVRILLVNNGMGAEFRINTWLTRELGKDGIEPFIAARGHYGPAEGWARSCGFHYISASTKEEFLAAIKEFCHPDVHHFGKPVVFEVFVRGDDEVDSVQALRGKPRKTSNKEKYSLRTRLLSCFILDREKRHAYRRRHARQ